MERIVQKGNTQYRIEESALKGYLEKGYSEIDKTGAVVQGPMAGNDVELLKAENSMLKAKLAEYETTGRGRKAPPVEPPTGEQ